VQRFLQAILVLVGVLFITFALLLLTGDPARVMVPPEAGEEAVQRIRTALGLDRPLYIQFLHFLGGAVQGNFGRSLRFGEPAAKLVFERFPATLELTFAAMAITLSCSCLFGIISAVKRHSLPDHFVMVAALVGQSMPVFWLGIMLILIFGVHLRWLPTSGRGGLAHLLLPALTLGAFGMARTTRLIRSGMLEVLGQEYIRTARAKGLAEVRVIGKHALKNASISVVTMVGLDFGTLLGGAVVTETVFAWPGVGRLAMESIYYRDFPVVQADVFYVASTFVGVNLCVDLVYTWLDPRIRFR
jgi:peptide/nickel transport system permease protein